MRNIFGKFASFMYGRYGNDKLNYYLIFLGFALVVVNLFVRSFFLSLLLIAIIVIYYFRSFSKNIEARSKENRTFLKIITPIEDGIKYNIKKLKDIKIARYRKCKDCKAKIRLPKKKGTHTVKCPRCGKRFKTHILF